MALRATPALRRGTPAELMQGFRRWGASVYARTANVSVAPGEAPVSDMSKKAFEHWRNSETGRWNPPKYSLRRQAQLVRAAYAVEQPELVKASPKYARYMRRWESMPTHEVFTGFPAVQWPQLSAADDAREAERIARTFSQHGPYAGRARARMFKGKKGDRASRSRQRVVEENMRTIDETIQEWREVRCLANPRTRPLRVPRPSLSRPCSVGPPNRPAGRDSVEVASDPPHRWQSGPSRPMCWRTMRRRARWAPSRRCILTRSRSCSGSVVRRAR